MVVLGRHERERVGRLHAGAPVERVLVGVVAKAGVVGLIQQRQADRREVRHVDRETAVLGGVRAELLGDWKTNPPGAGAGDQHL